MFIVGLGNPGEEYENSRHSVGRIVLEYVQSKLGFSDWEEEKKKNCLLSFGKIGKQEVSLILPETFMNKSGVSVKKFVTSKKKAQDLVVVYDDIDLPLGKVKITSGRGDGGHKGLASIITTLGTKDFTRIRIGICPTTPSGKLRKPKGEGKLIDFVIGNFTKKEEEIIEKVKKVALDIIETIATEGVVSAMNKFN